MVTLNLRHFRPEHLATWGVRALHPQSFLSEIFSQEQELVTRNSTNRQPTEAYLASTPRYSKVNSGRRRHCNSRPLAPSFCFSSERITHQRAHIKQTVVLGGAVSHAL